MKKLLLAAAIASCAAAFPARADNITLELNDEEQRVAIQLIDQAVRAGGLGSAEAGLRLVYKIQAAQKAAAEPRPAATKPKAE